MYCTNCGSKLEDGAFFCTECGARVQTEEIPGIVPESFAYVAPDGQEQPAEQNWQQPAEQTTEEWKRPYDPSWQDGARPDQKWQPEDGATQVFDHAQVLETAQEVPGQAESLMEVTAEDAAAAVDEIAEAADAVPAAEESTPSAEQQAIENFEQQAVQNQELISDESQSVFQDYGQWQQPEQQAPTGYGFVGGYGQNYEQPNQQWQQPADQQWGQWQQPADQQWQQPADQQWGQWQQPADQQWGQWQQPADQQWNQWQQPADQQGQPEQQAPTGYGFVGGYGQNYGQPDQQWQQPGDQQWSQWQQPADQQGQGYGYAPGYGQNQQFGQTQPVKRKKDKEKKKSKAPLFITLGVVLLALAAAAVWFFFLRHPKSDIALSKYISAEFSGIDGYGTISAYLDYDSLQKDIWKAMGHEEAEMKQDKYQQDLAKVYQFTGELYAEISQKTDLKNGDKVKVSIDVPQQIPDELCINVTDSEKEFTVEGLQEVQMFDPFEGIEVTFSGLEPFVKADYKRVKNDDLYYYVDFALDKTEKLSAGDTVTVTASYNADYLKEMGYAVSSDSKSYTVTSEGAYILEASRLNENIKADLDARSKTYQQEQAAGWIDAAKLTDMAYIGYAFIADEDFDPDYNTNSNMLFTIYNVYITTDDGPMVVYLWYGYDNVMEDAQGNQHTQTEVPRQVSDMGVDSRVWTANQRYYIAGFGTIDEMKAYLDNYFSGDGKVFYMVEDIPDRGLEPQQPETTPGNTPETTPAAAGEPGHLTDDPNGYIFPNSNTEYLDETFLRTLTDEELKYARNEIVARYGRKFKTPELAAYFGAKTWYHPTYEPEEFDKKMDSLINAFEKANVNLINKIEAERAAQKKQ